MLQKACSLLPNRHALALCLALLGILAGPAAADDEKSPKSWYRYQDAQGKITLSDQISEQHIQFGYDILDPSMAIVRHIPPFDLGIYLKDKAKRDAVVHRQQEDARLMRLYGTAYDAELAMKRQEDALVTSIGYNKVHLLRMKSLRSDLVEQAATVERSGKAAASVRQQIATYDQQILDLQTVLQQQNEEQTRIAAQFAPIIARLTAIEQETALRNQLAQQARNDTAVIALP